MKKTMWPVLALAIVAGGCGGPAGLIPVSGKVLYRGEPAAGAVVYFHRQAEPGSSGGPIPFGIVEGDGTFSLTSDGLGRALAPATMPCWSSGATRRGTASCRSRAEAR